MITLHTITLQRGTKVLFNEASVTVFAKQKIGVVGINGSGKSSFFALLLRQLQPDAGEISLPSALPLSHLSQEVPQSSLPALEFVMNGDKELMAMKEQMIDAEVKQNNIRLAELHHAFYEIGGYSAEARAGKLLNGLGFSTHDHQKAVNAFSGGWRMRLSLAQILMSRAELLLLDEPTNYLDLDAIIWLEQWLQRYDGTLLLISHDREFLDNVVQKVIHIHHQKFDLYSGNYSSFEEQRALKLEREKAMYEKQQAKIEHMTKYVNRFRFKASKARQAQSRLKQMEKMQRVEITRMEAPFSFAFYPSKHCSAPLIRFEQVDFAYDAEKDNILENIHFTLNPGDRIGLLGQNGAGKSTFIKLLCGNLTPQNGQIYKSQSLNIGYFAQHQVDQLNVVESAYAHIMALTPDALEQKVRRYLGGFGFVGDRVFQSIETFSGGEKARLVLALLIWQRPNLLLLDEPTNHLDLDMREALTYALQEYTGALVLVSHDRYLLKATVDEFYLVYDHAVSKFNGDVADYQNWLSEQRKSSQQKQPNVPASIPKKGEIKSKKPKDFEKQLLQVEKQLAQLCRDREHYTLQLACETIYHEENKGTLEECLQAVKTLDLKIKDTEAEWLRLSEEKP